MDLEKVERLSALAEEQRALFRAALVLRRDLDLILLLGWRR